MNTKTYLGNIIKNSRKKAGVDQALLVDYADISIWTLSRIENGTANPSLEKIENILEVLGLEIVIRKKLDGTLIERSIDEDR